MAIDHKIYVSEFISDKLEGFLLSIEWDFHWNLLKVNFLFLLQKCKHQLLSGPLQCTLVNPTQL